MNDNQPASKGEGWTGKIIDKIMEQCPILEDVPGKRLFRIMLREAIDPILKAAIDEAVEKAVRMEQDRIFGP